MTNVTPNNPSKIAWLLPEETNAAAVTGTSEAASMRSNAQWYDPWMGEGGGNGVGSLTVPLRIAARFELKRLKSMRKVVFWNTYDLLDSKRLSLYQRYVELLFSSSNQQLLTTSSGKRTW